MTSILVCNRGIDSSLILSTSWGLKVLTHDDIIVLKDSISRDFKHSNIEALLGYSLFFTDGECL